MVAQVVKIFARVPGLCQRKKVHRLVSNRKVSVELQSCTTNVGRQTSYMISPSAMEDRWRGGHGQTATRVDSDDDWNSSCFWYFVSIGQSQRWTRPVAYPVSVDLPSTTEQTRVQ